MSDIRLSVIRFVANFSYNSLISLKLYVCLDNRNRGLVQGEYLVLTFLLLNKTCPVLANSVDPDQLASKEAN